MSTTYGPRPILTADEMAVADKRAVDELGIPAIVLMENAARSALRIIEEIAASSKESGFIRSMIILCGNGNNGGDGLALARLAANEGWSVTCIARLPSEMKTEESRTQRQAAGRIPGLYIFPWDDFEDVVAEMKWQVIVDALVGIGGKGTLSETMSRMVDWSAVQPSLRIALDIPSGVNATTGMTEGPVFEADITITFGALKPGLLIGDGRDHSGSVVIGSIGAPPSLYAGATMSLLDHDRAALSLPEIDVARHKYERGKVLVIGGSAEMTGAPIMTALSALRAGAGLVVLAVPHVCYHNVMTRTPVEIMTRALPSDGDYFHEEALDELRDELSGYDAVAIGPGMGRVPSTIAIVRQLIATFGGPIVIDADGLAAVQALVEIGGAEIKRQKGAQLILTPHHGELASMQEIDRESVAADVIGAAHAASERLDATIVLKGAPTVIVDTAGSVLINEAGNPGMATAGSGDVLTGIILGRVGAGVADELLDQVAAAVYLHSHAADLAVRSGSIESLIATDIIDAVPAAFAELLGETGA